MDIDHQHLCSKDIKFRLKNTTQKTCLHRNCPENYELQNHNSSSSDAIMQQCAFMLLILYFSLSGQVKDYYFAWHYGSLLWIWENNLPKYIAVSVKFSWPRENGICFSFDTWLTGCFPLFLSNTGFYLHILFLPMPVPKQLKYLLRYDIGNVKMIPFILYRSCADLVQRTRLS